MISMARSIYMYIVTDADDVYELSKCGFVISLDSVRTYLRWCG